MRKIMMITLVAGSCLGAAAGAATSKQPLQQISAVENGLLAVTVADKIRRECGSISARMLKARSYLRSLYGVAREYGYSDSEIETYVNSKTQKSRMRAKRDAYLAAQGVVKSDAATYCAAGRTEIRNSSQIGALLKAR